MVDADKENLLSWWYSLPKNWAGSYKENDRGVVTLTVFKKPLANEEEDVQTLLDKARGRKGRNA